MSVLNKKKKKKWAKILKYLLFGAQNSGAKKMYIKKKGKEKHFLYCKTGRERERERK